MQLKVFFLVLFYSIGLTVFAQKKTINPSEYGNWNKIINYAISDDGRFIWYNWEYNPVLKNNFYSRKDYGIVLRSTDGTYEWKYKSSDPFFLGTKLISKLGGDSLCVFDTKTKQLNFIAEATDCRAIGGNKKEILIYRSKKSIIVDDLKDHKKLVFPLFKFYQISLDEKRLAAVTDSGNLLIINLITGNTKVICNIPNISKISINHQNTGIVFIASDGENGKGIYYYDDNLGASIQLISEKEFLKKAEITDEVLQFTPDDRNVYFKIRDFEITTKAKSPTSEKVFVLNSRNVWMKSLARQGSYMSIISIQNGHLTQLEQESLKVIGKLNVNSKYALARNIINDKQSYWNKADSLIYRLIDLTNGKQFFFIPKNQQVTSNSSIDFSSDGRYITWQNQNDSDYYSYEIATAKLYNNTRFLKEKPSVNSLIGWLQDDEAFLASNSTTVWQIDPCNRNKVIQLTGTYLKDHKFRINRLIDFRKHAKEIYLSILDSNNNNGFARVQINEEARIKVGKLCPVIYGEVFGTIKARYADVYITTLESEREAPNIYVSSDLEHFKPLSNIHPEKRYSWLTSQLIRWKMYDGQIGLGILYKPENLDEKGKYPIIFNFYQERNADLHKFWNINGDIDIGSNISIPEYVSNGYVVFVPDILNNKSGNIAKSTINSVESAAKYLIRSYPWINGKKMGIQGHSFGGYETNILVANSNIFSAACSANGVSNLVSFRGLPSFGEISSDWFVETGQTNMGKDSLPWNATAKYIENSPIFNANKVTTPLLLKHSKDDENVLASQSVEWFTALSRCNKPVWLLNYEEGGHVLSGADALDFSIKQRQFFDHYLMGKPFPDWMTTIIP